MSRYKDHECRAGADLATMISPSVIEITNHVAATSPHRGGVGQDWSGSSAGLITGISLLTGGSTAISASPTRGGLSTPLHSFSFSLRTCGASSCSSARHGWSSLDWARDRVTAAETSNEQQSNRTTAHFSYWKTSPAAETVKSGRGPRVGSGVVSSTSSRAGRGGVGVGLGLGLGMVAISIPRFASRKFNGWDPDAFRNQSAGSRIAGLSSTRR